jgi:hypothetical protein
MATSRLRLSAYLAGYLKAESLSHSHFPPLFIPAVIAGDSQTQDLLLAQARAQKLVRSLGDPNRRESTGLFLHLT